MSDAACVPFPLPNKRRHITCIIELISVVSSSDFSTPYSLLPTP
ncbi:hypothetical protein [Moorena sp. SIO1F2]|nr:hypothetical protein [Moorena sp. SIO1F2]